jgi:hypothetical protein
MLVEAHQASDRVRVRVQPDRGTLCAHWISVLICALDDVRSCLEFKHFALQALAATVFAYTGHAIPHSLRGALVTALIEVDKVVLDGTCRVFDLDPDHGGLMACSLLPALNVLSWLLHRDDAFAEHVRCFSTQMHPCVFILVKSLCAIECAHACSSALLSTPLANRGCRSRSQAMSSFQGECKC